MTKTLGLLLVAMPSGDCVSGSGDVSADGDIHAWSWSNLPAAADADSAVPRSVKRGVV